MGWDAAAVAIPVLSKGGVRELTAARDLAALGRLLAALYAQE
jgi:hypothetical protein